MRREPPAVDVEADLAVIDRRDMGVGRGEVGLQRRELRGAVLLEQVGGEGTREDAVVDPEDNVALRVTGGEEGAVEHLVRVAALEDPELQAALPFERRLHVLRDREGVVRDEDDLFRRAPASAAACGEQDDDDHGGDARGDLATHCCKHPHAPLRRGGSQGGRLRRVRRGPPCP